MTIMSFLALNLQVAEASVAMHEMPIATAAKEVAIRQATAFPFLEDVCIGRTRPSCRGLESHHRLSAAANRRRTDRNGDFHWLHCMSPLLARGRHFEARSRCPLLRCAIVRSEAREAVERLEFITLLGGTPETGSCEEPLPRVPFWFC